MTRIDRQASVPTSVRGYLLAKSGEGDLAFGSPHVFKAAAHNTGGRFDFMIEVLEPLTGPPLHRHEIQDDTFYVLEGVLTVQVGDEILDLEPGDFVSIPPGMAHTFDNVRNGDEPVRAVNVMTPGGLFPLIEDMAGIRPGPGQLDELKAVTRRHGTKIIGPPLHVTLGLV